MNRSKKPGIFIDMLENFMGEYITSTLGLSPNTETSYRCSFNLFIQYMFDVKGIPSAKISFERIDASVIISFLDWLESDRKCSVCTRNYRLAALKSFAKYASNNDFEAAGRFASDIRKIPVKRDSQKKRAFFTLKEVIILMDLPNTQTIVGRRDATLLALMFSTGARAQEMCDLLVKDIRFNADETASVTLKGKGRSTRTVTVCEHTAKLLHKYISYRRALRRPDEHVFISQTHDYMTVSCVEVIFKKYVSLAKKDNPLLFQADNYSPHSMRHTTAVAMLEAGVPLPVIQVTLGHRDIRTTQIYAEITQPSLDEALTKWNAEFWNSIKESQDDLSEASISAEPEDNMPDFLKPRSRRKSSK